ncbi:MAG: endolytic transglycosylase MltG [Dysgonamonadaceae bacterium]|jgi:UPF0755 protein|nr:endolytic transglycosylase MltG [Dysgonamonadaceae bacterium]
MRRKTRQFPLFIIFITVLSGGIFGYYYFQITSSSGFDIEEPVSIYIDEKKDLDKLLSDLDTVAHIRNLALFQRLAAYMHYKDNILAGRYVISPSMSYLSVLKMLHNGLQTPVKLTFNNVRLKRDLIEKVGGQLMFGEDALSKLINDVETCKSFGFDTTTIGCMFIPNTYDMYWNIPIGKFLERMKKEYDHFWTQERLEKAANIPLSPVQVAVLASIVEEETADKEDYAMIAGLYINRLRKGMLLQADPTVKFATGNFALRRILYAHLTIDSPYNTYRYRGLPPGPIRLPSIACLDAVLNYTHHNYLYMAARADFSGKTNFVATYGEHIRNAREYQMKLNRRRVKN